MTGGAENVPNVSPAEAPARKVARMVAEALQAGGVEIGEATIPGGGKVPAINVGMWQTGTVVKGLEVKITPNPKLSTPVGFQFLGYRRSWGVRFINNASHPDILERAAVAVAERFFPFDADPEVIEESPETCEQMTLAINADQLSPG